MAKIADIIKYEGDNSTFVWKHPSEDFNSLTQLIVHESQEAVFFMNGQALDLFGPGRYTLETQNIPRVGKLLNRVTNDETPFHCEVYFINKTVQMGIKWGTDSKVRFLEPSTGIPVEIGASGELNLAVSDSRKLLIKLVGTMDGISWDEGGENFTKSLQNSFRPLISTAVKTHLSAAIKDQNIDLLEVDSSLEDLSQVLRSRIIPGFEEYGLTIPQFYVTTIVLPEDDPNFKRLRELHTISFQAKMAKAEATVKVAQAEALSTAKSAEAEAQAQILATQRKAELEKQTTETEVARREAERDLIKAQAEAQASKMAGFAEAEVMAAKGYTEKDIIQADVQKAYAEGIGNMNISGGGGSVMGDMLGLGLGMAAAGAVAPQMGDMIKNMAPGGTEQSAKIKCPKCGTELPAEAKFCFGCGEKIEAVPTGNIVCPACGKQTPDGKFCIGCGATLKNKCPNCGADVPAGGKFCLECGTKIE